MVEVANAGEHHGHAGLVSCRNHLVIANGTPRLDHRPNAGLGGGVNPIAEGEESIGGHDRAGNLEPLIRSLDARNLGAVNPTRDFNYVLDTCRGFFQLAKSQESIGKTINIGSNYEISVSDTLEMIKKIMKSDVEFITEDQRLRPEKSEVFRLWCDNSLINNLIGFEPKFTIEQGLQHTINWFLNPKNLKKYKSEIYNT